MKQTNEEKMQERISNLNNQWLRPRMNIVNRQMPLSNYHLRGEFSMIVNHKFIAGRKRPLKYFTIYFCGAPIIDARQFKRANDELTIFVGAISKFLPI